MAKAKNKIAAVEIDPNALLKSIVLATVTDGFIYVTADNAAELIDAGYVEQNPAMPNPQNTSEIATRATDKGIAFVNELDTTTPAVAVAHVVAHDAFMPEATTPVATTYELDNYVPPILPRSRTSGESKYNFDLLEVGKNSIHVAVTTDMPDPSRSLAAVVSNATKKYAVGTGQNETVTVANYKLDADSKREKDADGHFIKIGEKQVMREIMNKVRVFKIVKVDDKDPKGKGIRIIRTK
ncbi:MAG: hypothetical protein K2W88_18490 [Pararheinheimera sp.]|nr:hypothetical protein [Rheinheimera sp.]